MNETDNNKSTEPTVPAPKPIEAKIWLTPEVVQQIIEADEIFEDIENELQEEQNSA
jgi:hypothetical protein|tara:strand:+ start:1181 stop:1348 length:168 start_codon:yes stop_codon:yes gene_type:complete